MTDGDNVQWLLGPFASSTSWFGSPDRGKVNLGWTVSPAMAEIAPNVLQYFYDHAKPGVDNVRNVLLLMLLMLLTLMALMTLLACPVHCGSIWRRLLHPGESSREIR